MRKNFHRKCDLESSLAALSLQRISKLDTNSSYSNKTTEHATSIEIQYSSLDTARESSSKTREELPQDNKGRICIDDISDGVTYRTGGVGVAV
jgi:hypothetical protein